MHRKYSLGTSLVVLWLGLCLSMQEVTCSVPGPTCLVAKKREKKKKIQPAAAAAVDKL